MSCAAGPKRRNFSWYKKNILKQLSLLSWHHSNGVFLRVPRTGKHADCINKLFFFFFAGNFHYVPRMWISLITCFNRVSSTVVEIGLYGVKFSKWNGIKNNCDGCWIYSARSDEFVNWFWVKTNSQKVLEGHERVVLVKEILKNTENYMFFTNLQKRQLLLWAVYWPL